MLSQSERQDGYDLTSIIRFDDKALQSELARPWTDRLPLVLLSEGQSVSGFRRRTLKPLLHLTVL